MTNAGEINDAAEALSRIRAVRLWHWRALKRARANERTAPSATLARQYAEEANVHLGIVQSLNDFFHEGDTAEKDDGGARVAVCQPLLCDPIRPGDTL